MEAWPVRSGCGPPRRNEDGMILEMTFLCLCLEPALLFN